MSSIRRRRGLALDGSEQELETGARRHELLGGSERKVELKTIRKQIDPIYRGAKSQIDQVGGVESRTDVGGPFVQYFLESNIVGDREGEVQVRKPIVLARRDRPHDRTRNNSFVRVSKGDDMVPKSIAFLDREHGSIFAEGLCYGRHALETTESRELHGLEEPVSDILLGLNIPTSVGAGNDPIDLASRADAGGFDFVSSNDHPCGTQPNFETWTLLVWLAARTTRVRVATRVLGVPYRPPAIVAKMAETLNRLSGGRFILGLGAGYSDEEFRAFGLKVPTPKEKIEGLEDAIRITRGLWTERSFTYEGDHYRALDADVEPKPADPIPIWLGTFGPRALNLTGRLADGWIPTLSEDAPPERVPSMVERIERAAEKAGRDPRSIRRIYNLSINLNEPRGVDPYVVSGRGNEVVEQLQGFVALGFDAFNFGIVGDAPNEQIDRLVGEVVPEMRTDN